MAFLPQSFISHHPSPHLNNTSSSFHPLFRLLDDFDQYTRSPAKSNSTSTSQGSIMKSFTPRFDVKETSDAYELYGELPGIDQQNINIEFVDADTLTINGKIERFYSSDTSPAQTGAIESASKPAAIKDKTHQPSVEDEDATSTTATIASSSEMINTQNGSTDDAHTKIETPEKKEDSKDKFWVSERSYGEFSRRFTFPVRVDQDAVTASMKNGILSVVVPKAKQLAYRKININ